MTSWRPQFLKRSTTKKDKSSAPEAPNENSSLLPNQSNGSGSPDQQEGEIEDYDEDEKPTHAAVLTEFRILLKGSVPVILAYALQNSLQTISVVIVGRGSPQDLATAAFAYMFAMSTAWLIALGGTTALDTLCSSTFTGSKNPHDLGVLLQRAIIVLSLFYIPVCVLWVCSEPLFKVLGEGEQLSRDSSRFLMALIPGGLGYIYFEAMKKYLQAQGRLTVNRSGTSHTDGPCRDHAARNLRAPHHLSSQRCAQLVVCLHLQDWSAWSTHRDRHFLLDFVPWPRGLHQVRRRVRVLGWLVAQMSFEHEHLRTPGGARSGPRGHGVVGF